MASTCRPSEGDPMGGEDDEIPPGWEMKDGNSDRDPPGGDCASTRVGGDEDALPVLKARGRRSMVDPDGGDPPPGWEAVARASAPDENSTPGWNSLGRCSMIGQVQDAAAPHLKPMPKHSGCCSEDDGRPGRREGKEVNDEDEDVPPGWEPKERDSISGEDEDVPPGWEPKEKVLMSDADEDVPPGWAPKARDSMDVTDEDVPPGWAPKERDTVSGAAVAEAPHHPMCYPDDDIPFGRGPKEKDPVTGPDEDPPGWESVKRNPVSGRDGDAPLGWKPKEMDFVTISSEEAPPSFEVAAEPQPPPVQSPEMGQMVCGNCRQLLSYARGAIYVQCACCQTINLVLQGWQCEVW
ncbi:ankyrin repeat domain-containing protein 11-like isoform X2 [Zingiber officinale]|uniref:ankyrin repeat domain-containing protein 11-like isoform X2 n=1 Tax=Zingiber officinale TaxID=94328 RepID=UPI001C4CDD55|nr:ankyrin repeat domain-containing protein 11-like isoform X2 [Zingiber officinale]